MRIEEYGLVINLCEAISGVLDKTCDANTVIDSVNEDYGSYSITFNGRELCNGSLYYETVSISFLGAVTEFDIGRETTFLDIVEEILLLAERDNKDLADKSTKLRATIIDCKLALGQT